MKDEDLLRLIVKEVKKCKKTSATACYEYMQRIDKIIKEYGGKKWNEQEEAK